MHGTDKEPDWALLSPKKRFIVAFSGGVDSTLLLAKMVSQFGAEACLAVYFDHGLRTETEQKSERLIIKDTLARLGVPGILRRLPIQAYRKRYGTSVEEAGRYLRYDLLAHFKKILKYDAIVTAHHRDDSVESFFMQLGSGSLLGAQGIRPHTRWRHQDDIFHPLWQYSKTDIVTQFQISGLRHSEDLTNAETSVLRNKVRHSLIPEADKTFPNFSEKTVRFGQFMTGISAYIAEKIPKRLTRFTHEVRGGDTPTARISLAEFTDLAQLEKEWVARYWLLHQPVLSHTRIGRPQFRFSEAHIEALIAVALGDIPRTSLPGNRIAWHEYGFLYFSKAPESRQEKETFQPQSFHLIEGQMTFTELGLSLEITKETYRSGSLFPEKWNKPWIACVPDSAISETRQLTLRPRKIGDKFQPIGMTHPISLKRYFINRKVPARWRGHLPLFFIESELVWIPFLGLANRFQTEHGPAHPERFSDQKNTLWVLTLSPLDTRFQPIFNYYNWM